MAFVLNGFSYAVMSHVVITAHFTERLPTAPRSTVSTNGSSAVSTLCNGTVRARCACVAVAIHMFDLAVEIHAFPESGIPILPCASKNILQSPPLGVPLL
jgi:hypothetical protein